MSVSVQKLDGVQSAEVSLNRGQMTIQLEPGNLVILTQVYRTVERNGFSPQEASVTARAEVIVEGAAVQLKMLGSNEVFAVTETPPDNDIRAQLAKQAGQIVLVEGVIPARKNKTPVFQVKSVKPASGSGAP